MKATIYKKHIKEVGGDGSIYLGSKTTIMSVVDDKHNSIPVDMTNPRSVKRLLKEMGYEEVNVVVERTVINRNRL